MAFVDGLEKPPETDRCYSASERCNNVIISYILRSLDTSIARSVIYCTTAREIWQDLEERFSQSSGPQLYSLQQNLHDLTQDPSDSIAEFFTQIKNIWDELSVANPIPICRCTGCTCGITRKILKQQQEERLIQLLMMKIDNKYNNVRSNLLMMQPLPNVQLAYMLLSQEEKQRQASALTSESMGHMAFTTYDQRERNQA
ncbi:uncharacterized protein LOC104908824 [Beta vulgaris subsp. vulgaris]|uniref:uncharacterized protein LOC104908824 n=1 Tax=Beta vulgaris subsp. vulgaris TaxID=3555 RepID=UPI00053F4B91|nr:uncharacterized protein LOC104908824 [Beta vulgaris subsp. vulgaris]